MIDGGSWRFVEGENPPSFKALCRLSCIDFNGSIDISGQADLRKVPILPKIRRITSLGIDVDGLASLSGLEKLEVVGNLNLSSSSQGKSASFKTLAGLKAQSIDVLTISRISSLANLSGAELKQLRLFSSEFSGIQDVDLSQLEVLSLTLYGNESLRSLALPSTSMQGLEVSGNSLTALSWGPGIRVSRSFRFFQNPQLSTCTIRQLESQAVTDAGTNVLISGNGPCP